MVVINKLLERLYAVFASRQFFYVIFAVLIFSASWIALTAHYPMAFDEDFHFGIIRLYASHASPWWAAHPGGADAFGAVSRDPSYFYHYFLSFPYRLISLFTQNQTIQVLLLRALNIGFFAASLPLYRRLLLKTGASQALVHATLAVWVLIPAVPLLAAQINYDNLVLPLTAMTLLRVLAIRRDWLARRSATKNILQASSLLLVASLTKYAFLPFVLACLIFLGVSYAWLAERPRPGRLRWPTTIHYKNSLLIIGVLVLSVLAIERYGINLVRYHDPVPGCSDVLSIKQCSAYPPWYRDYVSSQAKTNFEPQPVHYVGAWIRGTWLRCFFAVDGPASNFESRGPLWSPLYSSLILAALSSLAVLIYGRAVWRRYNSAALNLLVTATIIYSAVLFVNAYQLYVHAGTPVALNGRYLVPVMPVLFLVGGLAVNQALASRRAVKVALLVLALVGLGWGGGSLTYILRSRDAWYWPSPLVSRANHAVQNSLGPLTPGYRFPIKYLPD